MGHRRTHGRPANETSGTGRGSSGRGRRPVVGSSLALSPGLRPVPLSAVRLSSGTEFAAAEQLNTRYLLSLPVDRLLWSFRKVAGLPTPGTPFGAWEAAEGGYPDPATPTRTLRGHFVGHLLSGLALGFSSSSSDALAGRAAEIVAGLRACQLALGSGFVSAWPAVVLDTLEAGDFAAVWAPLYTLHKILAGLLDVHQLIEMPTAGDEAAGAGAADVGAAGAAEATRAAGGTAADDGAAPGVALLVAEGLVAYLDERVRRVRAEHGDDWWQAILEVEFGGIGEAAHRLAAVCAAAQRTAAAAAALRLGRAFVKHSFHAPLARGRDALGGLHANTHLPLLVHAARAAEVEALIGGSRPSDAPGTALADADSAAAAAAATAIGVGSAEGLPAAMLAASVQGYCTLQLGYAYAGSLGSSVNEHWPRAAASTGRAPAASRLPLTAPRTSPEAVPTLPMQASPSAQAYMHHNPSPDPDLPRDPSPGECERSAAYMYTHCAAACAADALRRRRRDQPDAEAAEAAAHAGGGGRGSAGGGAAPIVEGGTSLVAADSDGFHTQESCTQYNALRLNLELFRRSPDAALADAYERKLLNGVMGIQHPNHPGRMVYMMPLGHGVSKARANWAGFGDPEESFWCCYGTGVESFAKLAEGAFFEADETQPDKARPAWSDDGHGRPGGRPGLWVSQFLPSTLVWRAGGARLTLQRRLSTSCTALTVSVRLEPLGSGTDPCFEAAGCTVWLRLPSWAAAEPILGAPRARIRRASHRASALPRWRRRARRPLRARAPRVGGR